MLRTERKINDKKRLHILLSKCKGIKIPSILNTHILHSSKKPIDRITDLWISRCSPLLSLNILPKGFKSPEIILDIWTSLARSRSFSSRNSACAHTSLIEIKPYNHNPMQHKALPMKLKEQVCWKKNSCFF